MNIIKGLMLAAFLISVSLPARANNAQVEGITQFLIDRANDTYFYIFENKMKKSKDFACYFPEVYSYIEDGDLKSLIKSSDIWAESLEKDFKILNIRAVSYGVSKTIDFNKAALSATSDYAEILSFLKIRIDEDEYALNMIPLGAGPEVRNIINGFYTQFITFRDELINFNKNLLQSVKPCSNTKPTEAVFKENVEKLKTAYDDLEKWIKHIDKYKGNVFVDKEALEAACSDNPGLRVCRAKNKVFTEYIPTIKEYLEKPVVQAAAVVLVIGKYIADIQKRKTFTGKVVEAFKVIKEEQLEENKKLKKVKYYAMFIAQLADAENADSVENILKEYTLPASSFLTKREVGKSTFMISSYFGYAGGSIENDDEISSANSGGFYVPVGFEYSYGLSGGSALSVMFSPFDFGYPVSLRMNGEEDDVSFEDIVAPSISLAYGIDDYPVNIGIAYQKGKTIGLNAMQEKRVLFFIAFDMPLFAF